MAQIDQEGIDRAKVYMRMSDRFRDDGISTVDQLDDQVAALARLLEIAHRNSGQPRYVAQFLLGLYNGYRFPFDMTNFRAVDKAIWDDMMIVLDLDRSPHVEVHKYFKNGGAIFEALAERWKIGAQFAEQD